MANQMVLVDIESIDSDRNWVSCKIEGDPDLHSAYIDKENKTGFITTAVGAYLDGLEVILTHGPDVVVGKGKTRTSKIFPKEDIESSDDLV